MKKLPTIILISLSTIQGFAQSSNQNYIRSRTYTSTGNASATPTYIDEIQYFDGLGRPVELVQKGISPTGKDLVVFQEYDAFGRESKTWLPRPKNNGNGEFVELGAFMSLPNSVYNGDAEPFAKTVYENSPLNRVLEQYGAGADWHNNNKALKTEYLANNSQYFCRKFAVTENGISANSTFAENQLYVMKTTDEDGNISFVFKNKIGQVLLTRQIDNREKHDTYFVYDDFGNLRYVLPPLATDNFPATGTKADTDQVLKNYAYIYKYDSRKQMISKKLPGCEAIYYVYDKTGRLIFSQDGNQRLEGKWLFTIPDAFGRIVLTGLCKNNISNAVINDLIIYTKFNGQANNFYKYDILQCVSVNYSEVVHFASPEILLVNYYDNYNFLSYLNSVNLYFSGEDAYSTPYSDAKGLLTITIAAILGDSNVVGADNFQPLFSSFFYDERGRIIQKRSTTFAPRGIETENFEYNFSNQITERHHKIVFDAIAGMEHDQSLQPLNESYSYFYDNAGRLIDTWHNGILLSMNDYDEIGRLKTATIGGFVNHNFAYNVRSWIVGDTIPNPNFNYMPSSGGFTPPVIPPLFAEKLQYSFGGNIISNNWRNGFSDEADNDLGGYTYQYDNLNRLISAVSGACSRNGVCPSFDTEYQYDKHGNPLHITRYGMVAAANFNKIDDISFSYNGNQMLSATDVAKPVLFAGSEDFKDYSDYRTEYTYDANGNMTMDKNKGISSIQYNFVNLPKKIEISSPVADAVNDYIYAADGRKLQEIQTWTEAAPISFTKSRTVPPTKTMTKTYCSNMIFTTEPSTVVPFAYPTMPANGECGSVRTLTENGYIQNGRYYYFIKDYLGNNRLVLDEDGMIIQKNNYYPFGMSQLSDASQQDSVPYKFSGKELESEAGLHLYDFSARFYDASTGRFGQIDPMAEKYFSISPYAYCANNPILFIDPTGMTIWIAYEDDEGKTQKLIYEAGMKCPGINSFVDNVVEYLNAVNEVSAGAEVLSTLISSENSYDFTNTASNAGTWSLQFDYNSDSKYKNGGGEIRAASLMDDFNDATKVSSVAHELFHGYQREMGQNPATVNGEVGAELFGIGIASNSKYGNDIIRGGSFGNDSPEGKTYNLSMIDMLVGSNTKENYQNAIENFKAGSSVNNKGEGVYKNYEIDAKYKPLIFRFLPFWKND